jgi:hypothetical protein
VLIDGKKCIRKWEKEQAVLRFRPFDCLPVSTEYERFIGFLPKENLSNSVKYGYEDNNQ